jgi:peptidyl-prolyl cis-trans isomerase D
MSKAISPSVSDLEDFLSQNASRFRIPEQVRLKYLVFPASEANTVSEEEIVQHMAIRRDAWERSNPQLTEKEMRNLAERELKQTSGMQKAARRAKDAHDTIYQEENFDQFASQNNYTVHTTNFFSLAAALPREFKNIGDFQKEITLLQKNETSPVLSDDNKYYLFQRIEEKPAHTPSLKEIEASVRSAFIVSESQKMMRAKAQDVLDQLRQGADWRKTCAENRLNIAETGFFRIGNTVPKIGLSEDMSDAILEMTSTAPYPAKPFIMEDSAYIIRFAARETLPPGDYEAKKADLKQGLLVFRQETLLRSWIKETREGMMKKGLLEIKEGVETL